MSDRVLISGGTGLIGGHLVESLRASRVPVRILSRSAVADPRAADLDVERLRWDGIHLPDGALRGCSSVVHLAGEPIFSGPLTAARRRRIASSRIESTRSIAAALRAAPATDRPASFVCASAVGFYGSRGEEVLDESAGPGSGFLSELCQQWEAAAASATDALRVVSLRTGIVLARDAGALPMMALPFRFGFGGRIGNGRQWVPWIQIDDAVGLIRRVLQDDALHGVVNAVAPHPVRNLELATEIARKLHRPCLLPVPALALRLALGTLSDELLGSRRCIPQRMLDVGFEFAHSEIGSALAAELGRCA
ncbi:MAG: TIGR01777 family protein [Myxococcales bacterium]|nr:TIGR01777 family protein [Myxococcales bacterium]